MMGGAWGAVAQGVSDVASSALGQWQQNEAADKAWKRWRKRYQAVVRDLKKAGLNPILALQGGLGNAGSVPQGDSIGAPRSSAVSVALDAASKKAEIKNIEANTALAEELGYKARDEGYEASERGGLAAAQRAETLAKLPGASRKQRAEIRALTAEAGLNSARDLNEREMRGKARAEGLLYEVPAQLIKRVNSALDARLKGL